MSLSPHELAGSPRCESILFLNPTLWALKRAFEEASNAVRGTPPIPARRCVHSVRDYHTAGKILCTGLPLGIPGKRDTNHLQGLRLDRSVTGPTPLVKREHKHKVRSLKMYSLPAKLEPRRLELPNSLIRAPTHCNSPKPES